MILKDTKMTTRYKDCEIVSYTLADDFIKSATYSEFRKAAKENRYLYTPNKMQIWGPGSNYFTELGYELGSWLMTYDFEKSGITDSGELVKHKIQIIEDYGLNELGLNCPEYLLSTKLFIDGQFIHDYTSNMVCEKG